MPALIMLLCSGSGCDATLLTDVPVTGGNSGLGQAAAFAERYGWTSLGSGPFRRERQFWCKACSERRVKTGEAEAGCKTCGKGGQLNNVPPEMVELFGHTQFAHGVVANLARQGVRSLDQMLKREKEAPGWTHDVVGLRGQASQALYQDALAQAAPDQES